MSGFVAFAPAEWKAVTAWLRVPGARSRGLLVRDGRSWVVRGVREGPKAAAGNGRLRRSLVLDLESADVLPNGMPQVSRALSVILPAVEGDRQP